MLKPREPRDILGGDYSVTNILAHADELADHFEHDFKPGDNSSD